MKRNRRDKLEDILLSLLLVGCAGLVIVILLMPESIYSQIGEWIRSVVNITQGE